MKEDTNITNGILEDYNQNESLNQNDYKNYLKQEEFELLISKCCNEVKRLEKNLENEWDRKKQQYFKKIVDDIRKNFNLKYNAIREQEEIVSVILITSVHRMSWFTVDSRIFLYQSAFIVIHPLKWLLLICACMV